MIHCRRTLFSRSFHMKLIDTASIILIVYMAAILTPLEWFWYKPGEIVAADTTVGKAPRIKFTRDIKSRVLMRYHVTVRNFESLRIVCDYSSEPFTYQSGSKAIQWNLDSWVGYNVGCADRLKPGNYIMETCWSAPQRLYGLLPTKTTCRESNVFTIHPLEQSIRPGRRTDITPSSLPYLHNSRKRRLNYRP